VVFRVELNVMGESKEHFRDLGSGELCCSSQDWETGQENLDMCVDTLTRIVANLPNKCGSRN